MRILLRAPLGYTISWLVPEPTGKYETTISARRAAEHLRTFTASASLSSTISADIGQVPSDCRPTLNDHACFQGRRQTPAYCWVHSGWRQQHPGRPYCWKCRMQLQIDVSDSVAAQFDMHQPGNRHIANGAAIVGDALNERRRAVANTYDRDSDLAHAPVSWPERNIGRAKKALMPQQFQIVSTNLRA